MAEPETIESNPPPTFASLRDFLENVPPGETRDVAELCEVGHYSSGTLSHYQATAPDLLLHCTNDECGGLRYFRFKNGERRAPHRHFQTFWTFECSNCKNSFKQYALQFTFEGESCDGKIRKFGENPGFGTPTPTRLLKLLGDQKDVFLKGRRCENQGLGIGAFVYYRRVVEHQKNRFLSEIISAAKLLNAPDEQIVSLEAAKAETQFTKAVSSIKDALPQALLVQGHNPLTLLHSALSAGVHEDSDEECLALAQDIRVVLVELADRLSQVLKDNAELKGAVSRLLKKKAATSK